MIIIICSINSSFRGPVAIGALRRVYARGVSIPLLSIPDHRAISRGRTRIILTGNALLSVLVDSYNNQIKIEMVARNQFASRAYTEKYVNVRIFHHVRR